MAWLHAVIDVPSPELERTAEFWGAAFGWPVGSAWTDHPELRSFEPPRGRAYLHLQHIEGSPGIHIDLESEEPDRTVELAVSLGSELVGRHERWRTLRSPGLLAFCVVGRGEHEPPEPVTWPDGHRTRMVQVCVDAPRSVHHVEVAFWRALLQGRWAESRSPEFAGKWHDDAGSPVQLLFQRLDETAGPVRAHLDLGTDDLEAEVQRLRELGAKDVGPGRGRWHVLRDPADLLFCVTDNSPSQTRRRDI